MTANGPLVSGPFFCHAFSFDIPRHRVRAEGTSLNTLVTMLLAVLREGGSMTIADLARRLKRDYKNVHGDVEKLRQWQAVEKDDEGRIFAPYSEIVVDVRLPQGRAA